MLNISENEIDETPAFGASLGAEYILGMAKMKGNVKILLYIDKALSTEEIATLKKTA